MCWKECDYKEIRELKMDFILELPWNYPEEGEHVWKYEMDNLPIAFIRLSLDPVDKASIWIDEFEVIKKYRRQGRGKRLIWEFLKGVKSDVKLLAKNKNVQLFWEKCGFVDNGITWAEIPMIYKTN